MRRLALLLMVALAFSALWISSGTAAPADETVTFQSAALEAYILKELKQEQGPLTASAVSKIKKVDESAMEGVIEDLSDLQKLPALMYVTLTNEDLTDISPLAGVAELYNLTIIGTQVKDLSPMAGHKKLTDLRLEDTQITDLSPLTTMKNLTWLYLKGVPIESMQPLQNVPDLDYLYLIGYDLENLDFVNGLTGLRGLNFEACKLHDLSAIVQLTDVWSFAIRDSEIAASLAPLEALPITSLTIAGSGLTSLDGIPALPELTRLSVYSNKLTMIGDLTRFPKLSELIAFRNEITDIIGVITAPTLTEVDLSNNQIAHLNALEQLPNLKKSDTKGNPISTDLSVPPPPLTVASLLPSAGEEEQATIHSIQPAESMLPDFGAMAELAPLTDQAMEASGLRTMTYTVKSSTAVSNFVKAAEADGFITARTKQGKQEIIQLSHPLMAHGFTLIHSTDLKLVSVVYPADAALGDAEAMAAFWYANKPYSFYDSSFELIARNALRMMTGAITPEMIATIESLSLQNRDVYDFRDLAMFTGLKTLTLESVGIEDIAALAGMRDLEELCLRNVPVSSIKPLEGLSLKTLKISETKVRDLKPLMKMADLTSLRVDHSRVEALPDLSGTSLRFLYLNGNSISDVASLAKLTALEKLELNDNAIRSIKPLAQLSALTWLELENNPVKDYSPAWDMQKDKRLHFMPSFTVETSAKGTALTVRVLPGCRNPEDAEPVVVYIEADVSDGTNSLISDLYDIAEIPVGGSATFTVKPYMAFTVVSEMYETGYSRYDTVIAPKAGRFADFGFSVKKSQMVWLAADANERDYYDPFNEGSLKDLTAKQITNEQLRLLIDGKQKLVLYIAMSMNALKHDSRIDTYCIVITPDGRQAVYWTGYYEWKAGDHFGMMYDSYFSEELANFFRYKARTEGEYTLHFLFNDALVSTETFTIVP